MSSEFGRPREDTDHPREVWALVALTVGLALGPIGIVLGWVLTFTSQRWTTVQKALAAFAVPVLLAAGVGIFVYAIFDFSMEANDGPYFAPWEVALIWVGFLGLFILPAVLVFYLNRAARRVAQTETARVITPSH